MVIVQNDDIKQATAIVILTLALGVVILILLLENQMAILINEFVDIICDCMLATIDKDSSLNETRITMEIGKQNTDQGAARDDGDAALMLCQKFFLGFLARIVYESVT